MGYNREIRDPIYGFIKVDKVTNKIIDHPFVQRLRWVNQLPLEQLVYPSANHSRFEHSLGVMHLAGIAAQALYENSRPQLEKAFKVSEFNYPQAEQYEKFTLVAKICGLLHDIGHAPFSHTFEESFKVIGDDSIQKYDHETFGSKLVDIILGEINDELLDPLKPLIKKVLDKENKREEGTLSGLEIILRRIIDHEFDVDKGDYLLRDSYHCGVNYGLYEYQRLWTNICLTDHYEIVPNNRAALEVWRLILARYFMFENVYEHKFRLKTDAMLVNVISEIVMRSKSGTSTQNIFADFKFLEDYNKIDEETSKSDFINWNDQYFISYLRGFSDDKITNIINNFFKRVVFDPIDYRDITLDSKSAKKKLVKELWQKARQRFPDINLGFYIKEINFPSIDNEDIAKVKVIEIDSDKNGILRYKSTHYDKLKTLAEFLSFNDNSDKTNHNTKDDGSELTIADSITRRRKFRVFVYCENEHDLLVSDLNQYVNNIIDQFISNADYGKADNLLGSLKQS